MSISLFNYKKSRIFARKFKKIFASNENLWCLTGGWNNFHDHCSFTEFKILTNSDFFSKIATAIMVESMLYHKNVLPCKFSKNYSIPVRYRSHYWLEKSSDLININKNLIPRLTFMRFPSILPEIHVRRSIPTIQRE